jgi:hypothetical protein
VEADDAVLLVGGEVAPLDVRAEVVDPAQAGVLGQRAPVGVAVLLDVGRQPLVLLGAPRAPAQALLLAARRPPHRPHRSCLSTREARAREVLLDRPRERGATERGGRRRRGCVPLGEWLFNGGGRRRRFGKRVRTRRCCGAAPYALAFRFLPCD